MRLIYLIFSLIYAIVNKFGVWGMIGIMLLLCIMGFFR